MVESHAHDAEALERWTAAQRDQAGMCTSGDGANIDAQIIEGPSMGRGEVQGKGTKGGKSGVEGNSGDGRRQGRAGILEGGWQEPKKRREHIPRQVKRLPAIFQGMKRCTHAMH